MRHWFVALPFLALASCSAPSEDQGNLPVAAEEDAAKVGGVDRSNAGKPGPDIEFAAPDGDVVTLADFAGRPLLLNLWATWCAPCVKELPTLDRLASGAGADGVQVVAVSQDMGPQTSVSAFLDKLKLGQIEPYHDSKMALSGALNAQILPTTILYDAEGKEVWRYVGDLDWTGAEAATLLAEGAPKTR